MTTEQLMEELQLDLDVLCTLTDRDYSPKLRGWFAATKIERAVREWHNVRMEL